MEINEAVSALLSDLESDPFCGQKKVKQSGAAVIDGINGGVGSADTLRSNMLGAEVDEPTMPAKLSAGWDLCDCNQSSFPYQSHHLVPEKQLPDHAVTVWLTKTPHEEHPEYVLENDTNYDTNGSENGYFMPFASTTHQWLLTTSGTRHHDICWEMMRRTHLQLHQGPHSTKDYLEEVDDVETAGYKTQVEAFLTLIYERAELHVKFCEVCKSKASPKIKVQPLNSVVKHVNLASFLLQILLESKRIFVSRRAANYFEAHQKNGVFVQPKKAFVEC